MKMNMNNKYIRWGITAFLVIVASLCFYYLLFHGTNIKKAWDTINNILMPIVFGFTMAYLMTPVLNFLEYKVLIPFCNKIKWKESKKRSGILRGIGIFMTIFIFIATIYFLIAMMLSQIVPSISNIVSNYDVYTENFITWLNNFLSDYPELESTVINTIDTYSEEFSIWLNESIVAKSSELLKTVSLSVIGMLKILWNLIVGLVISIYILASKDKFAGQAKKMTFAFFEKNQANVIINNFRFTHRTFIGFISGKVLDSIIIGLLCYIGTTLMNTPYAALVSLIVGVTNVIPFFGPYLGAIPCVVLIFVVDPLHFLNCVYFAIFILVLQQFDGNFLGPLILGDTTGLASFWVIFSITFFGGIFGVLGMVVGVPIFAVLYAAIKSVIYHKLNEKNFPLDTSIYIKVAAITDDGIYEYLPDYKMSDEEKDKAKFGRRFVYDFNDFGEITSEEKINLNPTELKEHQKIDKNVVAKKNR